MFWQNYLRLCNGAGQSPNAVAAKCGVRSSGTVSNWKNGATPRDGVLRAIADYFGVETNTLLLGTVYTEGTLRVAYDAREDPSRYYRLIRERPEMAELLDCAGRLTEEEIRGVIGMLKAFSGEKQR